MDPLNRLLNSQERHLCKHGPSSREGHTAYNVGRVTGNKKSLLELYGRGITTKEGGLKIMVGDGFGRNNLDPLGLDDAIV